VHHQSAAIVEHLAETLSLFQGGSPAARQAVREWLYWDVDALFPPVFGCYSAQLAERKLLPLNVDPAIAVYHHRRAETALWTLDSHLSQNYLCAVDPTIADLFCYGDVAFAEICAFDLRRWPNISGWAQRVTSLPGFKAPFQLLSMQDAEL